MRWLLILGISLSMVVTACADKKKTLRDKLPDEAAAVLAKAQEFELYSLDPGIKDKGQNGFHGRKVLGKTTIKKGETSTKLLAALDDCVGDQGFRCFSPRHAIRVVHEGKKVDLLICFECAWIYVYSGNELVSQIGIAGKVDPRINSLRAEAEPLLDRVLKDAGVPLAPKPEK